MKFTILIHDTAATRALFAALADDEKAAAFQVYWDVERELTETGRLVDSKAVASDAQLLVTRDASGAPVATPAPEGAAVSGYYTVDVADEAEAVAIAARFPEAGAPDGIRVARVWTDEDFAAATT